MGIDEKMKNTESNWCYFITFTNKSLITFMSYIRKPKGQSPKFFGLLISENFLSLRKISSLSQPR